MQTLSSKSIGLITATLMVASSLIMYYVLKLPETGATKYTAYSIYVLGIVASLYLYQTSKPSNNSFKDYFSEGFKTFVIVTLIMAVFTFVFYKLNPQILDNTLDQINKANSLDPNKTTAEVLENSNKIKGIFMPMTIAINTIIYMVLGALISVIGAAFFSQQQITNK
jgi:Protein of unknown function (DUF4199)